MYRRKYYEIDAHVVIGTKATDKDKTLTGNLTQHVNH